MTMFVMISCLLQNNFYKYYLIGPSKFNIISVYLLMYVDERILIILYNLTVDIRE